MVIEFIDRESRKICEEKVFGEKAISFLYGNSKWGSYCCELISRTPLFSALYGLYQRAPWTRYAVKPFIKKFDVVPSEFEKEEFKSFNDFFIRKLKKSARPINSSPAIMPADARYLAYQNIQEAPFFTIKGQTFTLDSFLNDRELSEKYAKGSALFARLCPSDYHRFHFPIDCIPSQATLIDGCLYSVNPKAIQKRPTIFSENKRMITKLYSPLFGQVLFIEIGATNVGTIVETYTPSSPYQKGDEKGYFSFGGSSLCILFQENTIEFDKDIVLNTKKGYETYCRMGQSLGKRADSKE